MKKTLPTQEFYLKTKELYGTNKYSYSRNIFKKNIGLERKINVECKYHGDFSIIVKDHLSGIGCYQCFEEFKNNRKTFLEKINFIDKAHTLYDSRYKYSDYQNLDTLCTIFCKKHYIVFHTTPKNHLEGNICGLCSLEKESNKEYSAFFQDDNSISYDNEFWFYLHKKDNYDYSNTIFIKDKPISIKCKEHGEFTIFPTKSWCSNHICPYCQLKQQMFSKNIELLNASKKKGVIYVY